MMQFAMQLGSTALRSQLVIVSRAACASRRLLLLGLEWKSERSAPLRSQISTTIRIILASSNAVRRAKRLSIGQRNAQNLALRLLSRSVVARGPSSGALWPGLRQGRGQ